MLAERLYYLQRMPSQPPAVTVGLQRPALAGLRAIATVLLAHVLLPAQAAEEGAGKVDRKSSYYHFALGHLYHQFAQQYMRDEYVNRAEKEYAAALESDPRSTVIRTEMINLFAGANKLPKAEALAEEMFSENPENIELHRLMGRIYRSYASKPRQGWDPKFLRKAIESFERVAELDPDKAENHVELGILYRSAGRLSGAERSLRKALELDQGQADTEVTLANLLLQAGKHQEAIEVLEGIVDDEAVSDPRHIDTLASAYQQVGRFRAAAEMLQRLIGRGGNQLQIRRRLAESLFLSRQFGRAQEEYEALIEAEPSNPQYYLRVSQIEQERDNFPKAWEALESARRLDPDQIQIHFQAINLLQAEGRAEEAADQIEKVLDSGRKPEYAPDERRRRVILLDSRGKLLRKLNRYEEAVQSYAEIGDLNSDARPEVQAEIVETWRSAGDFARAEKTARRAAGEFEGNTMLSFLHASVLADLNKTKEAIRVVERAFRGSKPDIDGLLTMARIYEKGRQFEKAEAQIDLAGVLAETDPEHIAVLFAYGSLHERAKQYDKAEQRFRELLEKDPENAGALNYLGYMFADRGIRLEEAHDLIQKALDMEPDNGAYLDSLGWVYYHQNKLELAAKYLERSLEQYEDDPIVHSHLGDVYFKQGRAGDANLHWTRALKEWKRSAPAERDDSEIASLRRKLADLKVSLAGHETNPKAKGSAER